MESQDKTLWVRTRQGIDQLDFLTGEFKHLETLQLDSITLDFSNVGMFEDRQGMLWISRPREGLLRLNPVDNQYVTFQYQEQDSFSLIGNYIRVVFEDRQGSIWVWGNSGSEGGLHLFDRDQNRFARKLIMTGWSSIVTDIGEDSHGNLWLFTRTGLFQYNVEKEKATHHFDPDMPELFFAGDLRGVILIDDNEKIWMGGNSGGLVIYDPHSGKIQKFSHDPFDEKTISSNKIIDILKDRENNIWIATDNGLNLIKSNSAVFQVFKQQPEGQSGLNSNSVHHILEDSDSILWVGDNKGWSLLDLKKEEAKFENNPFDWMGPHWALMDQRQDQPFTGILYEDRNGTIWIGRNQPYPLPSLSKFNPIEKQIHLFDRLPGGFSNYEISSLFEDHKGTLWANGDRGLLRYDPAEDYFFIYPFGTEFDGEISESFYPGIVADKEGDLWVGSDFGLFEFDRKTYQLRSVNSVTVEGDSIHFGPICALHLDKKQQLWIGTKNFGIFCLNIATNHCEQFTIDDGLPSNLIHGILEDERDILWFTSNVGLVRFDPITKNILTYNEIDGLPSREFNPGAYHQSASSGVFYIGTTNGLVKFHPEDIKINPYRPPIVITSLRRYDSKDETGGGTEIKGISWKKAISLPYHQNTLLLEFAALSYIAPAKNRYAYQLEGANNQWINLGAKRQLSLTDLNPGKYTLRIRGSNNDGIWNETGASLQIAIRPPWYWAWWSKTLYFLTFFSGLYALYIRRTQEQKKKLAQEQLLNTRLRQIDQLKDQFLANTSHELRTPLHGILGITESLFENVGKKSVEDLRQNLGMIMASGRRLSSLVNDLLDFSRAKNKDIQLQPKSLDLRSAVEVVLHSCRPLLGTQAVNLKNVIPEDLPPVLADENRLQQILYNLVGNAIKFTESGYIKIGSRKAESEREHELIQVFVEDTGIGIPPEKHQSIFQSFEQAEGDTAREFGGTGLGLSITKQLVELHGGEIWVESQTGKGATFFFSLPISDQPTQLNPKLPEQAFVSPAVISDLKLSLPVAGSAEDRIKILVVDDEPINHQVLRNHLSAEQFMITSVMSGQEALETIELGVKFDLVLLDVMMPRISGYEVCQKIRQKHLPNELPIIMVTAKNQIQDLVEGLAVGANDYLAKPFSRDEFLARVKTQLDLHRINLVTGKFVPNEFLRALGRERITEVVLGDYVEREVTVLFSDIRDYTTLAETMTPEQNYRFVKAFNSRMGPIIRTHQGFVNQYLGDGIMAIFPEKATNALNAAIHMQKTLREYNQERSNVNRRPINLGIGIHSGPLVMGIIGDEERLDAATIADTVNTASRIEELTKYYGVNMLLSEASLAQCEANSERSSHFRFLGKVQVKGRQVPIPIYECFDGDASEVAEQKWETLAQFEAGMHYYFNREFPEASSIFNEILKKNPEDTVARLFLNRAAHYIQVGVPKGWTGEE